MVALGTSACSGEGAVGKAPAATVGSTTISRADLDAQLKIDREIAEAQAKNQGTSTEAAGADFVGAGTSTVPATKTSSSLTILVQFAVLRESLDAADVSVTADDRTQARTTVTNNLQSQGIDAAKLPKAALDQRVEFQALQDALQRSIKVSDAQLQAAYVAAGDTFDSQCISVVYVADEAAARAALARIQAGEDIGAVSAEVSIDDSLKQAKGAIGCAPPSQVASNLSPEVAAADVNQPVGPIQDSGQSGWLVAEVTSLTRSTLDQVRDQLTQQIQQQSVPRLITSALKDIHIDPRYGTWDDSALAVRPPVAPTVPGASTTTSSTIPATASATGS